MVIDKVQKPKDFQNLRKGAYPAIKGNAPLQILEIYDKAQAQNIKNDRIVYMPESRSWQVSNGE